MLNDVGDLYFYLYLRQKQNDFVQLQLLNSRTLRCIYAEESYCIKFLCFRRGKTSVGIHKTT